MGEANESIISYEDLLSTALGESGLDLDDLFGNVPGNVLSQATLNDSDVLCSGDSDVLDSINVTGDFSQDNSFINFAAPNNSLLSSSFASAVPNIQVSGVQQTFLEQPPTIASLFNQGTSGQSDFNNQSEQLTNAAAPLGAPCINSSAPSPLLLNLLNSGNGLQMSSISSVTEPMEQLNSENGDSRLESSPDVTINHVEVRKSGVNEDEEEDEEEELGHTDTYAEYVPSKLTIGRQHPDPVVETSSLSSVTPPDIWYILKLPQEVIDYCHLSALQLEAVVYACQQHETFLADGTRAGFLIGDGAGVGKGRTVAGIIYENYLRGRKRALRFSVSNDLKYDAERDLNDIGCSIDVSLLNKYKYKAKLSSKVNGKVKKGVVFATYSSLIGESQGQEKYNTRMSQLLNWCGHDFDGVIVLDECHKAKNLVPSGSSKPTKTGLAVLELQNKLPKARVVYCSATGASEPKNMAYMSRLGIWGPGTPFREFSDFIQAVEKRGVGAMEIVAMDMKLRGMYMTRQLSFAGVTFDIKELPLSLDFIDMYNDSVKLWIEAREKFEQAAELMGADGRAKKTIWGQFWSAHQRFFKYLCIASKVDNVVDIAKQAIDHGKCVIIGLQSTGEARTLEQLEESGGDLTDFVSTAKGVLQSLIKKHFPAPGNKLEELFGFDSGTNGRSSPSSQQLTPVKRQKKAVVAPKPKKFKTAFERIYNISTSESDSDDSGKGTSSMQDEGLMNTVKEEESLTADSSESTAGEDDFNPFGNSGSEDEDPWLHRKSKKGSRGKSLTGSPDIFAADPTSNALAAAGLKVSNMSWSIPSQQETARQINGINYSRNSPLGHLNKLHHSASAPGFSSLTASSSNAVDRCRSMKKELLAKVEILGNALPPNTLDKLIHDLGGPDNVAEMTGRKNRVVSNEDGTISYESRSKQDVPLELLNIAEKKRFMDGEKNVAVISEAASSGVSLQADRRAKNQRRRVHITLELPWSADKAIQQFGRSHRSNQVSAPEYLFLISELAGERRFASIVAKRLESLRALTHGDRRATESQDLSRYNFDNKHGKTALEAVLKAVTDQETPMVPPPKDYGGNFLQASLSAEFTLLNRYSRSFGWCWSCGQE
ncbi:protein strawberry notch homolog 1-like isoform X1 [Acropora muricata]|uniref:protein strawberry notch homolog 1-like isoform X1 n=1 Tax=Acropora muricata TaxID=159855 RepID=UPI0034E4FFCE